VAILLGAVRAPLRRRNRPTLAHHDLDALTNIDPYYNSLRTDV
jgi:hypothetical protein